MAAEPANSHYLRILSECHSLSGCVQLERGNAEAAIAALDRAHELQLKLIEKNPNVTLHQDLMAGDLGNAGVAYAKAGKLQKSLEAYQESRRILEKLAASDPGVVKYQRDLASTINNIGDLELGMGRYDHALATYSAARTALEPLVKSYPQAQHYQLGLAFSLAGQGRAKWKQGKTRAAVADLRASSSIWERLTLSTNESQNALAGNHALVAAAARETGSGVSSSQAEIEADRAVECLQKPSASGYRTVAEVLGDPQFRTLRGRSNFEGMLLDRQFPREPFARP